MSQAIVEEYVDKKKAKQIYEMLGEYFFDSERVREKKDVIDVSEAYHKNEEVNAASVAEALFDKIDAVETLLIPAEEGLTIKTKALIDDIVEYVRQKLSEKKVVAVIDEDWTEYIILK